LDIYLERSAFERVPFPDRQEAIRHVASAWCSEVESFIFLPSVRLRDIQNGDELGSFYCAIHASRKQFGVADFVKP